MMLKIRIRGGKGERNVSFCWGKPQKETITSTQLTEKMEICCLVDLNKVSRKERSCWK